MENVKARARLRAPKYVPYGKQKERTPIAVLFLKKLIASILIFLFIFTLKNSQFEPLKQVLSGFHSILQVHYTIDGVFIKIDHTFSFLMTFSGDLLKPFGLNLNLQPKKTPSPQNNATVPIVAMSPSPSPITPTPKPPVVTPIPKITPSPIPAPTPTPSKTLSFQNPMKGTLSSKFGYRVHPIYKKKLFHYGIDLAASMNQSVMAAENGTVVDTGNDKVIGNYVKLSHGEHFETLYAHLSKSLVKLNQTVKKGDQIGNMGNSGVTIGPHLHFEVRKDKQAIDPLQFVSY